MCCSCTCSVFVLRLSRRLLSQLEEGEVGMLHPVYQLTCQPWVTFMANLGERTNLPGASADWSRRWDLNPQTGLFFLFSPGCPSIQQCKTEIVSQFLLPSVLTEIGNLVNSLASDTTVKAFERRRWLGGLFNKEFNHIVIWVFPKIHKLRLWVLLLLL